MSLVESQEDRKQRGKKQNTDIDRTFVAVLLLEALAFWWWPSLHGATPRGPHLSSFAWACDKRRACCTGFAVRGGSGSARLMRKGFFIVWRVAYPPPATNFFFQSHWPNCLFKRKKDGSVHSVWTGFASQPFCQSQRSAQLRHQLTSCTVLLQPAGPLHCLPRILPCSGMACNGTVLWGTSERR